MTVWLAFFSLFALGSLLGWCIEVIYRRFAPDNKEKKWINPGFCIGPYLPIYGFALCVIFALANIGRYYGIDSTLKSRILLFVIMAICITIMEYIAGKFCIVFFKVKLWDYSKEFLNIEGIICLKFTFYWWLLSAAYYFLIDPKMWEYLIWLNDHLSFSFFVGVFYGIFIIDVIKSMGILNNVKRQAIAKDIVLKYEKLQAEVRNIKENIEKRKVFFTRNITDNIIKEAFNKIISINEDLLRKDK